MPLYKLDELTEGSAFEQEYDKGIAEGLTHVDAVERASAIIEELTPKKVLGYALVVKNFEADVEAINIEISKLKQRAQVKVNKAEALITRLEMFLPHDFVLEDARAVVKFKKNPPSVFVDDESVIPDVFKKVIPATKQLVKADLLKALKQGEIVQGARLAPEKHSLQIK